VVGGTRLLIGSVEYEFPIRPSWAVALFADSGNAFDETGLDAKTGVGVGVR
jgi:translocation and assembly module TamA